MEVHKTIVFLKYLSLQYFFVFPMFTDSLKYFFLVKNAFFVLNKTLLSKQSLLGLKSTGWTLNKDEKPFGERIRKMYLEGGRKIDPWGGESWGQCGKSGNSNNLPSGHTEVRKLQCKSTSHMVMRRHKWFRSRSCLGTRFLMG